MLPSILIENVTPRVADGPYAVKRVVGDVLTVEADIFRDGPEVLRASLVWWLKHSPEEQAVAFTALSNDRWRTELLLERNAAYCLTIEAWSDPFLSWLAALERWVGADQDVRSEVHEGMRLISSATRHPQAQPQDAVCIQGVLDALESLGGDGQACLARVSEPAFLQAMARLGPRTYNTRLEAPLELWVDRPLAACGAWYEMFPRSQGAAPGEAATLREAEARLSAIRDLGFDVVYLPPVHPIGTTHRKGRDNSLVAQPGDPGSPWAVGAPAGGHKAVEPALGTLEDFAHFVRVANRLGLEIALDLALQCSPDHPWVREHPEWFLRRPDGSIKYAENPPKRYQDVYPLNFQLTDPQPLWLAVLDVLEFWIEHGVKVFRVDNPHTKPFPFWHWLIGQIRSHNPEVIFLAEAFTRPKVMKALAKVGFTQSYTYFTWRSTKAELAEYLTELTQTDVREYMRPNFFVNTPDILQEYLQMGGRAAFMVRLVLAATLSPAYGIYSGFELCENQAIPGTEEYLHSEKYEIKARDWNQPGNLNELIARVNGIRRENPALQQLVRLRFLPSDNDHILCYVKASADGANVVLVAVNLDPFHTQACTVQVPGEAVGLPERSPYEVFDMLNGARYLWGASNYVRLTPEAQPAHIFRVERTAAP